MPTTDIWRGASVSTPQVDSLTPASVGIGNVFNAIMGGKTVSFVATAATVANVTAGLSAAMTASPEPEFRQVTAADNTTNILVTGPDDGTPFTLTASATGGTATLTRASVTAPRSANDWSATANWSAAAIPVTGDTVIADNNTVSMLYGIDQNAVALAALNFGGNFTGLVGLPERNDAGFFEYRETYLKIGTTVCNVGQGGGPGSGRIKLDTGGGGTTFNVFSTGAAADANLEAVLWKGTGTNVVNVNGGSVGIAVLENETATVATLRVRGGDDSTAAVRVGSGVTLTTLEQDGGTAVIWCGVTTVNKDSGTLTVNGGGAVATLKNWAGRVAYNSGGNIGTLAVGGRGAIDFTGDTRPIHVTGTCTVEPGGTILDPGGRVTFDNGIICSLSLVTINPGPNKTISIAAGP